MGAKNILIVEDERIIADDIRENVEALGYSVAHIASSGEEAIVKASELMPDLALMDVVLTGEIDGITAAKQIYSNFGIPVVYLTSHSDEATLKRAKASGPFGYLVKPFNRHDLHTAIELALYRHALERRLIEREQRLSTILRSIGDAVIVAGPDGLVEYINPVAEALTGWGIREAEGRALMEVFRIAEEVTMSPVEDPAAMVMEKGVSISVDSDHVLLSRDGSVVPIERSASPVKDEKGNIVGVVLVFHEIFERKLALKSLEDSERFLNTIFDSIHDPFCIFDREFTIVRANEGYARLKGVVLGRMLGKVCHELFEGRESACEDCVVMKTFDSAQACAKEKSQTASGAETWTEIYTYPIINDSGEVTYVIEYTRDITARKLADEERKKLIENLEHISKVDSLTGILNRRALMESLRYEAERASRYRSSLSLILCDIDRFKDINDTYGHSAGDKALEAVAAILRKAIRQPDIIGRYGGDEFMVILPETTIEGAEEFAERIRKATRRMKFSPRKDEDLEMSMSLGVADLKHGDDSADSLIKKADIALYASKREGRDRVSVSRS